MNTPSVPATAPHDLPTTRDAMRLMRAWCERRGMIQLEAMYAVQSMEAALRGGAMLQREQRHPDTAEVQWMLAWALLHLDLGGQGGYGGQGGALPSRASKRLPAFQRLGRGRWQAIDGPHWLEGGRLALLWMTEQLGSSPILLPVGGQVHVCWSGRSVSLVGVESGWLYATANRSLEVLEAAGEIDWDVAQGWRRVKDTHRT